MRKLSVVMHSLLAGWPLNATLRLAPGHTLGRPLDGRHAVCLQRCLPSRGLATQHAAAEAGADDWAQFEAPPSGVADDIEAENTLAGQPRMRTVKGAEQDDAGDQESWQDVAARRQQPRAQRQASSGSRIYEDDEHSIRGVHIPRAAWTVLMSLRGAGHEAYIVGGAIRDMLLKGAPKDFDILTSASGQQVRRLLRNSRLIGRRFPIVQVTVDGMQLEVSSFATGVALSDLPFDTAALLVSKKAQLGNTASTQGQELLWKAARQQNAAARDFTVNALLYDPFSRIIFDYTGGVADCRRQVLRTIVPPLDSFEQDPARILRAIRLAARAGLKIDDSTAKAIEDCHSWLLELPLGRVLMEVQAILGVGAAAPSMQLLWRHGLMELLFPAVARYLEQQKVSRHPRKPQKEVLFRCLAHMDAKASPDKPMPASLWLAVIATPIVQQRALKEGLMLGEAASGDAEEEDDVADSEEEDSATDSEDAAPGPSSPPAGAAYRQVAKRVVDALMDDCRVQIAPKAIRQQVLKLLEAAEAYRRSGQKVKVACRDCGARVQVDVPLHVKLAKLKATCSACGADIPSKLVKKRLPPEARTLLEIMQAAAES